MIPEQIHEAAAAIPKVELSEPAQESTYAIAHLLMKLVHFLLSLVGLENNQTMTTVVYAALVFLIAIGVGYIVKWILMAIMNRLGKHLHAAVYGIPC